MTEQEKQVIRETLARELQGKVNIGHWMSAAMLCEALAAFEKNGAQTKAQPMVVARAVDRTTRRRTRGGKRGRPALAPEVVAKAKALRAKGVTVAAVAKQLGISAFTVHKYTKA